jgi:hypothetical protein
LGEADTSALVLPEDLVNAGFSTVGSAVISLSEVSIEEYEKASQALATSLFSDEQRWRAHVGCEPQADLGDVCVETYVRSFGREVFRRDLTDAEVTQWVGVARAAAAAAEVEVSAATGLAAVTAGLLQSPNFLYRFEHAVPDLELGRIKFDGPSMATRLAYLLTGAPPDAALLDAAAAGQLDTPQGVRSVAEQLATDERAAAFMSEFFSELAGMQLVLTADKSADFDQIDDALRQSMLEETMRWLSQVVLAPGADVRSFFDSPTTFVDQRLAEFYGVQLPAGAQAGEFQQVTLPADSGRVGILGKAGFLFAHSSPDSSNPTRRGNFILKNFKCLEVPKPSADVMIVFPEQQPGDAPKTTRQLFEEQHMIDATCVACHTIMDPFGFALEHFDAVGQYRETENGLPIDDLASYGGDTFDGIPGLASVLREDEATASCFIKNFYRYANATGDDKTDSALVKALATGLADRGYVWRDLLIDFAASEAFGSLPATFKPPVVADAAEATLE